MDYHLVLLDFHDFLAFQVNDLGICVLTQLLYFLVNGML
jgi:hypothetical protein